MWLLLIVLIAPPDGFSKKTLLEAYHTEQECMDNRNRVGWEMAEAYPQEPDFRIVCEFDARYGVEI